VNKKTTEKDINTHVVAVFAFVQKDGRILFAKRSSTDFQAPGAWSVPGGKVDADEGDGVIEEALKKEVKEEVGIEIEDNVQYFWSDGFYRISGHHVIGLCFLCRWKFGNAKPLEDQDEVRWFTKKELKTFSELPDYFKPRIDKLLQISW